ncbi:MAG: DUF3300 domain-containing protein [Deltaproteobacteria bacterium]|nr:DUF3300 domain-containing protein [Deltaproteobacteria bacterium]
MNRKGIKGFLRVFVVSLLVLLSTQAMAADPFFPFTPSFEEQELDNLLAPIALYPDPLLAQMLPASTYPAEIAGAADWLRRGGSISGIDRQNWDESVKAIAHYPNVLNMMADNMDWTADLGDAFLNQPENVANSIQRLRWQARRAGNLESTSQHTVIVMENYIEIIPAQPQYMYVPQYDPSVIYVQSWVPGRLPFMTFGLGLAIGGWLTLDFDWGHRHVIYHGWNRPGWVNHSRSHVRIKKVYVHRSRPYIRQTWRHDVSRGNPERYRALHPRGSAGVGGHARMPEIRGSVTAPPKPLPRVFGPRDDTHSFSNRGRESRRVVLPPSLKPPQDLGKQRKTPVPSISKQPVQPAPGMGTGSPQIRPSRESVQPPRAPSVTFGGYRGDNEARSQSLRGKTSRQSSEGIHPAAPMSKGRDPADKSDVRGRTPAGKDDIRGKMRR